MKGRAAPESGSEIPTYEQLIADPEIEALVDFEPVLRKVKVANGWTDDKQRELIARMAVHGSPGPACVEMGMHRTSARTLYNSPYAESFRAAWDAAAALGTERQREQAAMNFRPSNAKPPSLDQRRKWRRDEDLDGREQAPDDDEDRKWHLIQTIGVKFMRKVAAEREARLAGEIVAADFYLRQVTVHEVMMDLLSSEFGWDPREVLAKLRRGRHGVNEIASTWLSDWMDRARREWWLQEGEPKRPAWPETRFLERRRHAAGDYAIAVDMYACNGMRPPPGIEQEQWDAMSKADQNAAIARQREEDAEEQRVWEATAHADWVARQVTE